MKFCQRCEKGIINGYVALGGTLAWVLGAPEVQAVSEADCEFWAHKAFKETARWLMLEAGGDKSALAELIVEVEEVVEGKREQYLKGIEP